MIAPNFISRRSTAVAAALVAAVAVAAYAGTLGHGFALDDGPEVVDNAHVRSLSGAGTVFATSSWAGAGDATVPMYRPLTTLSYSLNYALGGFAPFGFHLVNVLLHAVVCVLVLLLGLHLGLALPAAATGALLFAVMPVHVEAVANVAGRKDLLAAAFAIGAVLAHARALRRGGVSLVLPPLLVAGALLSKESGLVLVGLLGAHDLLFAREEWRTRRRRVLGLYASYVLLTVAFVLARHAVLDTLVFPRIPFDENPVASTPAGVRMMTAVAVLGRGLLLLVAPVRLSPDYSFAAIVPVTSPFDPAFLASLAAILGLGAAAWRFRTTFPLGPFAFLWYGISIFPASNLLVPIGTIFGERLLYVPSVAFALFAGAGAGALLESRIRRIAAVAIPLILLGYAVRTWDYSRAWENDLTVFTAAASAQPDSAKAQRMLGGALMEAGRPDEAAAAFRRAAAIIRRPGTPQDRLAPALVELGVAQERTGQLAESAGIYEEVLRLDPRNGDALWRLGVVRWLQGDRGAAIELWTRVVTNDPSHARAWNDLGVAAAAAGDGAAARSAWERATAADPNLASAWYRLGNLLELQGDVAGARRAWERFLDAAHDRFPELRQEVARKLGTSAAPR
ncbi:MAG: tetratricopeptide repeat protein [Anaeromyxobacteraceae bacterium]